jgi:hypothetical protein
MSKAKTSAKVYNLLCKLMTKWRNVCISCLFGDFNVYGSPLSNNIRLSHRITPTDIIGSNAMISYLLNYISETVLEMEMQTHFIRLPFYIVV